MQSELKYELYSHSNEIRFGFKFEFEFEIEIDFSPHGAAAITGGTSDSPKAKDGANFECLLQKEREIDRERVRERTGGRHRLNCSRALSKFVCLIYIISFCSADSGHLQAM